MASSRDVVDGMDDEDIREQDRLLPIANVARIMKRALPENAKIAKDAKECVQDCVSEFIAFLTSEGEALYGWMEERERETKRRSCVFAIISNRRPDPPLFDKDLLSSTNEI